MAQLYSRKVLGILLILILLAWVGYQSYGLADLRTHDTAASYDQKRGRQLLHEMGAAHGIEKWIDIATYSVIFEDEFYGFVGQQSHPYSEDKSKFELQYCTNSYDGRLKFLTGPEKGFAWGIQSWQTYTEAESQPSNFEDDKDIQFWIPTYQYFIEFPSRIQSATAVAYAGESSIKGQSCFGILASWNTIEPQDDIDQYLIWIDQKTKRIVKLEYTVREMYGFLTGAAYFNKYVAYDGLLLPSLMPVESNLVSDGFLHEMRIQGFEKNNVPLDRLRPNQTLPIQGDTKP